MLEEKREERIRNRRRKRNAELLLLSGQQIGDGTEEFDNNANQNNEEESPPAKLAKELSRQLNEERAKRIEPELVLTLHKLNGRLPSTRDLASLLHYSLIGSHVDKPNWLYFKGLKSYLHTVLLRVNCLESHMHTENAFINSFFEKKWTRLEPEVCNRMAFWKSIVTVKQTKMALLRKKISETGDPLELLRGNDVKLELLLSLEQMAQARFPLTDRMDDGAGGTLRIIPTKQRYRKPNRNSPIFVIDCEMCLTIAKRHELTRVSVINENAEVLLDTLVKPYNEITDYLTEHSGITKEMLNEVKVRLPDVQRAISKLLPKDAILCGHSLEFDLRALQMSHPFCIDLSTLYNFSNNSKLKSSLRTLAQIFLREDIQNSKAGHCSVEDSIATLKLLKLKLEEGILFGNVMFGWNFKVWAAKNGLTEFGSRRSDIIEGMRNLAESGNCKSELSAKDKDKESRTSAFAPKLCVRCARHMTIKCGVKNCLCIRSASFLNSSLTSTLNGDREVFGGHDSSTNSINHSADYRTAGTADVNITNASNASPIAGSPLRRRRLSMLCVECISSSYIRRSLLRKTRNNMSGQNFTASSPKQAMSPSPPREFERYAPAKNDEKFESCSETSEDDESDPDSFDFGSALRVDRGYAKTVPLSDNISLSKKNFLAAIDKPNDFLTANKRCFLMQCGADELEFLEKDIAPCIMEYNTAILEANCASTTIPNQKINDIVRAVTEGVCRNGLIMVVMAAPKKSILYIRLKK